MRYILRQIFEGGISNFEVDIPVNKNRIITGETSFFKANSISTFNSI